MSPRGWIVLLKVKGCLTPLMDPTLALLGFKLLVSACDRFGTYMRAQLAATKTGSRLLCPSFCATQMKLYNPDLFAILHYNIVCLHRFLNIQNSMEFIHKIGIVF